MGVRRPWRKRGLALLRHAFGECMRVRESYAIYLEVLRPGEDLSVRS